MKQMFFLIFFLMTFSSFASTKVALVKLIRGEVSALVLGKTIKLKLDDWVEEGAVIKTEDKSFIKLIFTDKSQMNVGPNSQMKIEKFSGKDSGVIDLVKGKIRSQVTKDYLQIKDKDKSKLFIKTSNAVMGVRGTDFMISTNGQTTSTILFEGEIVFNRLENRSETSSSRLEDVVDRGVRILPGEFSVMEPNRNMPTVPAVLNPQQREKLESNQEFNTDRAPSNSSETTNVKNVVPEGLTGAAVANSTEVLKAEVSTIVAVEPQRQKPADTNPEGFMKGDLVKPANGSFVHIDSGVIIPPAPGSVLDANTNTFIPAPGSGKVGADGNYIPPKNVEITNDGKILVAVNEGGVVKVREAPRPAPVVTPVAVAGAASEARGPSAAGGINLKTPPSNDIINSQFVPSGMTDLSNNQLNRTGGVVSPNDPARFSDKVETTIIVKPQ